MGNFNMLCLGQTQANLTSLPFNCAHIHGESHCMKYRYTDRILHIVFAHASHAYHSLVNVNKSSVGHAEHQGEVGASGCP